MTDLVGDSAASTALWLLVLTPAVVGAVLALAGPPLERVTVAITLVTATAMAILAAIVVVEQPAVEVPFVVGTSFTLAVDPLSGLMVGTVTVVTLLVLVFSAGDIRRSRARFFGLMLLFASSVLITATATTLPALLVGWEVMGAMSYALIGFWWRDTHRVDAGGTAFLTTRAADLGLYAAAAAALAGGAGLGLAELSDASAGWRHLIAGGVLVAALGKAAQLPFSFWLSRAMEGPSPVSALLHSAAMVAMGAYLLLRTAPLLHASGWAAPAAAWIGALTALLLGAVALAQRDLKQLLAASTAAQLGFVVLGAGVVTVSGGASHLVAHASTKALLFLAAGAWLTALGTQQLPALRGVARRWPVVGVCAGIGALSLAGIPPLALWATKDEVLAAAHAESLPLYLVGLAASALSAGYAAKVLLMIWQRRPRHSSDVPPVGQLGDGQPGIRHVGVLEQAPLVVLAVGAAALGLLTFPPLGEVVRTALGEPAGLTTSPVELILSAVLAIAVAAAVARWGTPEPRWAINWLGLEHAAQILVVRPTVRLADALAKFDDRVLDRAVDQLARGGLRVGHLAARTDSDLVDAAVEAVARRVRRWGEMARAPQTGQLHDYYAQAVAVLSAGAILLLLLAWVG